jgi:hypothetical protein
MDPIPVVQQRIIRLGSASESFSAKHVTFNTHRFTSFTQSDYTLRKSFIADNAANTHVINHHHRNRLVDFRPGIPGDSLLHGNSSSLVAGYGGYST